MKRPGGLYVGSEGRQYLAIYNYQHDVSTILPREFRGAERVAMINYTRGGKRGKKGGVDVFLLNDNLPPLSEVVSIKKVISQDDGQFKVVHDEKGTSYIERYEPSGVDVAYDIQNQVVASFPENIRREVIDLTRADIYYYCEGEVPKKVRGTKTEFVERIVPVTEMETLTPKRFLTSGKQEFVPQCILEGNIDFTNSCVASWIPREEAAFDGKYFRDYWQFIWGDCDYCYAMDSHKSFPKSIYEFDKQMVLNELRGAAQLTFGSDKPIGRPVEILRFGKRTEPWTPFTEDNLLQTLEAMTQTGTKGVITTKFLPFDNKFIDLLRKTKSTVLYSIGGSADVELGPLEWGCDNEFRMEQAAKYKEVKVASAFFYLMNPAFPPSEADIKNIEFAEERSIPIQFIPARFYKKDAAQKMIAPLVGLEGTDLSLWEILRDRSPGQIENPTFASDYWFADTYEFSPGNILVPKLDRMDTFWKEKIAKNRGNKERMCAHDSKTTFCGGCFTKPGTITPTAHPKRDMKLAAIMGKSRKNNRKKNKFRDINQRMLPILQ